MPDGRPLQRQAGRWLAMALVLLASGIALTIVAAGDGIVPGDIAIARAVQTIDSPHLDAAAHLASQIGDEFPSVLLLTLLGVAILTISGRRDLAVLLATAAALRALGPVLKVLINSPRPTLETVVIVAEADGMGFPSGHALGAALFYGAIVVIAPKAMNDRRLATGIQVLAIVMMAAVALSRIRLGVHWPSDVAGGIVFGWAMVCALEAGRRVWLSTKPSKRQ